MFTRYVTNKANGKVLPKEIEDLILGHTDYELNQITVKELAGEISLRKPIQRSDTAFY